MGEDKHTWPEAKMLCRLNQNDIAMAKRLGFGPDSLVRSRPDPKQKWKLPVKYWIHELHFNASATFWESSQSRHSRRRCL